MPHFSCPLQGIKRSLASRTQYATLWHTRTYTHTHSFALATSTACGRSIRVQQLCVLCTVCGSEGGTLVPAGSEGGCALVSVGLRLVCAKLNFTVVRPKSPTHSPTRFMRVSHAPKVSQRENVAAMCVCV